MRRCQVRITRIFNTYGPRLSASDGRIVSNVIVQALAGKAITVNGDGEQTRSFCYVSDLIEGLIRLMAFSGPQRSEEHTSELQSLMRISYAVFCLKKKNHTYNCTTLLHSKDTKHTT